MSRGSPHVEIHVSWKHTRGSTRVEGTDLKRNNLLTKSIALHYTNILWFTSTTNVTHRLFGIAHIKLDIFFSGTQKFWEKYRVVLWIKLMYSVTNIKQFYCLVRMHEVNRRRNGKWPLWENSETCLITNWLLLNSWMVFVLCKACY